MTKDCTYNIALLHKTKNRMRHIFANKYWFVIKKRID